MYSVASYLRTNPKSVIIGLHKLWLDFNTIFESNNYFWFDLDLNTNVNKPDLDFKT